METSKAQAEIFKALVDRGYADDLGGDALTARQVAKMLEEVLEATDHVTGFSDETRALMVQLHERIRSEFDDLARWQEQGGIVDYAALEYELCDVGVTLANAAEAMYIDEQFDVMQGALRKATHDVKRGVRNA